jgi:integrase/recombinase XerD
LNVSITPIKLRLASTHQDAFQAFQISEQVGQDCLRRCMPVLLVQAIEEFFNGYFSTHERSAKTKVAYRSDLDQVVCYAGDAFTLSSLDPSFVENWAADLRLRNYSPASMRRKMVVLKVFCSYWVRKGFLIESPFWRVKLSFGRIAQLPRALSETEMRGLLTQAKQNESAAKIQRKAAVIAKGKVRTGSLHKYRALRNLALVDLLFATGMRVGEVSTLNMLDFSISEAVFRVKGKGGRDRLAFIVDDQSLRIQQEHVEMRSHIASESQALFLNATGGRLSTQGIANVISRFREDAGIERHITPHMLRHTVATLLLRNGVDIRVVQEFLGHASIATTQRYTHVTKDHLVRVLRERHPSFLLRSIS